MNENLMPESVHDGAVLCPHCGESYPGLTWAAGEHVRKTTCDSCKTEFWFWKRIEVSYCASTKNPKS